MALLTPLAALTALLALLPVAAVLLGQRRVAAVRAVLGLSPPGRRASVVRVVIASAGIAVLGLAAAQPALTRNANTKVRKDVEALFVIDTSRSMAASATPTSPTRLDRAADAAVRLRLAIPTVASGIATLTDRVLPDLLPVADSDAFAAVARRTVQIESPPPRSFSTRATTFNALGDVTAGNYFVPGTSKRIVVLLTDGESNPVDVGELAGAFGPTGKYRFLAVHLWRPKESVYDSDGTAERAYQPDPTSADVLDNLATSLSGRSFAADNLGAATAYLKALAGSGATAASPARTHRTIALTPYFAALGLLLVVLAVLPGQLTPRSVRSFTR